MLEEKELENVTGVVFNIQKFSVHDGSGIRTTVFLKGCPLRCRWCCNPESQLAAPQISRRTIHCLGAEACGRCLSVCEHGCLTRRGDAVVWNPADCVSCGKCAEVCLSGCAEMVGKRMTAAEVVEKAAEDSLFYTYSSGGLTLSGGEVLMQPRFSEAICRLANREGLHVTIETSACARYDVLLGLARYLDAAIIDVKHMDPEAHRRGTGVDNRLILENIRQLCRDMPELPLLIRTPVIPGYNDDEETIVQIARFAGQFRQARYELLPYHRLGEEKYGNIGRRYALHELRAPKEEHMAALRKAASAHVQVVHQA